MSTPHLPSVSVRNLSKTYTMHAERIRVLDGVSFSVSRGQMALLMGPSGSGKTTLLSILAALEVGDSGSVTVEGSPLNELTRSERARLRRSEVGVVFQDHRLFDQLTASENVEAPLFLQRMASSERQRRAMDALFLVGLADRAGHRPSQLSGGERQRVAIARAIVGGAKVLLCDEPTGSVNREVGEEIFELLRDLCHDLGRTAIVATHDVLFTRYADQMLTLEHGSVSSQPLIRGVEDVAASGA